MHIRYTEQSLADLDAVINYIAKDSLHNAINYIDKMKSKIELLQYSPDLGIECKYKGIQRNCRVYIIDAY